VQVGSNGKPRVFLASSCRPEQVVAAGCARLSAGGKPLRGPYMT
jgi:hypothetical protein